MARESEGAPRTGGPAPTRRRRTSVRSTSPPPPGRPACAPAPHYPRHARRSQGLGTSRWSCGHCRHPGHHPSHATVGTPDTRRWPLPLPQRRCLWGSGCEEDALQLTLEEDARPPLEHTKAPEPRSSTHLRLACASPWRPTRKGRNEAAASFRARPIPVPINLGPHFMAAVFCRAELCRAGAGRALSGR
jgi:hypothetical protein